MIDMREEPKALDKDEISPWMFDREAVLAEIEVKGADGLYHPPPDTFLDELSSSSPSPSPSPPSPSPSSPSPSPFDSSSVLPQQSYASYQDVVEDFVTRVIQADLGMERERETRERVREREK
jgi:hypothetical protein